MVIGVKAFALLSMAAPRHYTDSKGIFLKWGKKNIELHIISLPQELKHLSKRDLADSTLWAAQQWTNSIDIEISVIEDLFLSDKVQEDGYNTVSMHYYPVCGPSSQIPDRTCADTNRFAHTTLYPARQKPQADYREIVEADIELNAALFGGKNKQEQLSILRPLILHEMGHLLGLGHNCVSTQIERQVAGVETLLPLCDEKDEKMTKAVMFPYQVAGKPPVNTPTDKELAFLIQMYGIDPLLEKQKKRKQMMLSGALILVIIALIAVFAFKRKSTKSS